MSEEPNTTTIRNKLTIGKVSIVEMHHPTCPTWFDGRIFLYYDGEEAEFPADDVAKVLIEYFRRNF